MKNIFAVCLGFMILWLAGCVTAPVFVGAGIQTGACELSKAKPMAKGPLHAAGLAFKSFSKETPPTDAELQIILTAIPEVEDHVTQVEIESMWALVVQGYSAFYNSLGSAEKQKTLQAWFAAVGAALDNGSTCGAAGDSIVMAQRGLDYRTAITCDGLAGRIVDSMKVTK